MSADRDNKAHRRSLPVTTQEHSQVTHRKQIQEGDGSLNKDLHISSLGSFDHESNSKYMLPSAVPHPSNEDNGRLEGQNPPDQDGAPPRLHGDITRKKIEAMKIDRYQEKLSKLKGKKPNHNMPYQAGKKEVTRIPRKRGRSHSCSGWVNTLQTELEINKGNEDVQMYLKKYDSKNSKETRQSLKLPSMFETQMPSARHCVSASYADTKSVQYASKDMNQRSKWKKRRNQHYIRLQDTLLDKDLRLRVKDFLEKPQPKPSTPSLRIKKIPDIQLEGKDTINHESSMREQFRGVPINTNSCPLMSHFKDRKWYYQDKTGKCRYLRVPESPVPPVSFVFTKD